MAAKSVAMYCDVWLVRHGEREDEVPGNTWGRGESAKLWFDPPLTARGKVHARDVAREFKNRMGLGGRDVPSELQSIQPSSQFRMIYVSPLVRAVMTASQFSSELFVPLCVVPGLATCAAAVHAEGLRREGGGSKSTVAPKRAWLGSCFGVSSHHSTGKVDDVNEGGNSREGTFSPLSASKVEPEGENMGRLVLNHSGLALRSMEELQEMCPEAHGRILQQRPVESFQDTMERLCVEAIARHSDFEPHPPRILVVAHREAIRDLAAVAASGAAQPVPKTPYACVSHFRFWPKAEQPQPTRSAAQWQCLGCEALVPFHHYTG